MSYFPFMIDIRDKKCLVAGGGRIAFHKVRILLNYEVKLFVTAPVFDAEFDTLKADDGQLLLIEREFQDSDIDGMDFVIAATNEESTNQHISDLCRQKGILVNAVDMKEACSFIFPAILRDEDMLIAVSSGGQSPAAVSWLKEKLRKDVPSYYGEMVKKLGEYREMVMRGADTAKKRKEIFYQLLAYGDAHEGDIPEREVRRLLEENAVAFHKKLRIGTRGSELALVQTEQVAELIQKKFPDIQIEKVILRTQGDKIQGKPLQEFGGKAVFVTEFEQALLDGRIDLAVHSSKDMPTELGDGLVIAGALPREDARDVLVTKKGMLKAIEKQEQTIVIGTGSLRRSSQLQKIYPQALCKNIRGNVPTRIQKLRQGEYDGIILAAAGLKRLGLLEEEDLEYRFFSYEEMIPAGGQGIIAIEGRAGDEFSEMMHMLSDKAACEELVLERNILKSLNAGCHEAVGVIAQYSEENVRIRLMREVNGTIKTIEKLSQTEERMEAAEAIAKEMLYTEKNEGDAVGRVYLVGAGTGDAGLLTIKGMEKLQECDAVVFDRLASEELLDYVSEGCEKIYVGKQAGKHYKKQEEINRILVDCAKKYKKVVRLKGGDSFVFGRGGEEIEALEAEQIPYEVIAGVTSAVAVPECAGIPVTHRGVSRSFHVITGHTKTSQGSPDYDYQTLAKLEGTLVFLMGLSNLGEIAEQLLAAGKAPDTPVAVIANGTTARQQAVRGSLADIDALVKKNALPSPAVIVIGETAGFHFKCEPKKRVGITATKALRRKLARGFEELGMEAVSVCDMELVKTPQIEMLRQEMKHMERYGWVLFTSQNAVSLFFEEWKKSGQDIRSLGKIRFAVLGSGTADKLLEYGIQADFIPSRYVVSVLAEEFAQAAGAGERVLIPRAVQGSSVLTDVLKKHNVEFLDIAVYDVAGSLTENISILDRLDYLVFVSASGVQAFFTGISERGISLPDTVKIVCIGEITEKKLDEYNGKADVVAGVSDVESLLAAVKEDLYGTHEKITDK